MTQRSEPRPSVTAEAMADIRGWTGPELGFVTSLTAPLAWVLRDDDGNEMIKNGSMFFLDAGEGVFAVTAAHVVRECLNDSGSSMLVQCCICGHGRTVPIRLHDRIISAHPDIDIATFRVTRAEVELAGRTVLARSPDEWPPRLAELDGGVTLCGFPGNGRRWLAPRQLGFGIVSMGGIATNVHETRISIQIEREKLIRAFGDEDMSENFDFGGMSGGPVLAIVQSGLRSYKPAGVIFQGPNPSDDPAESIQGLQVILVRPLHFVNQDGTLDIDRWQQSNPLSAV